MNMNAPPVIPLESGTVLVQLHFGGYLVVPTWNLDVAVGLIRDRIIEPWTSSVVASLLSEGEIFANVGANIGYYMALAASRVGRGGTVFAIEPNPVLLPYLMRTTYWTGYPDVIRLFGCAITNRDGDDVDLYFDPQYIGGGGLVRSDHISLMEAGQNLGFWSEKNVSSLMSETGEWVKGRGLMSQRRCQTRRLDTVLRDVRSVDVLMIDVEGSEFDVICSAKDVISRSPNLKLVMEWSPYYANLPSCVSSFKDAFDFLEGQAFKLFRISPESWAEHPGRPTVTRIRGRDELLQCAHGDLFLCRDTGVIPKEWRVIG